VKGKRQEQGGPQDHEEERHGIELAVEREAD
jgi:hypothetical protein